MSRETAESGTATKRFVVRVSDRTMQSAVHRVGCAVTLALRAYDHVHNIEAANAQEAANEWDRMNDTIARKLPATIVCRCARTTESGAQS